MPLLVTKITTATRCRNEEAIELLTEVVRFMQLVASSDSRLSPSVAVDLAWHEFILFTHGYASFCEREFGRMIHHQPGGLAETNRQQFLTTLGLYRQHFGAPDPLYWGDRSQVGDSECGACDSNP